MNQGENILSVDRAARLDLMTHRRRTEQRSRDGSLRGLASEVLGEERASRWLRACDALEAPLINAYLLHRARSSRPLNFSEAAAAVWA